METLTANLRYGLRMLRKNPGFTAIAVSALAVGIGANTAIFTVVNAVLLQPLPYPQPDRLMRLGRKFPNGIGYSNSIPKYMAWRHNEVFDSMALYDGTGLGASFGADERAEPVATTHVSRDYFKVFGVPPLEGRSFTEAEDLPNGPRVAVLSYHVWRSRLGGDPAAVGRVVTLNGEPRTVVGIMPESFRSDSDAPDTDIGFRCRPIPTAPIRDTIYASPGG